ncbi:MAG: hypothetical protein LBS30_04230, partial [Planctomycetota bacterium]|nr:hypothetical protein [Planctomycetota bacterium]
MHPMRRRFYLLAACSAVTLAVLAGCGNPLKRPPANVFPGSQYYADRVEKFTISPEEAYDLALE